MLSNEAGLCPIAVSAGREKTTSLARLMKEFIGHIQYRLPDAEGRAQFLFAHSSGALLKVMLKPGAPLPHDRQPVLVLGELVGARIHAHEIVPRNLAGETT
jgi:hypothetical protein